MRSPHAPAPPDSQPGPAGPLTALDESLVRRWQRLEVISLELVAGLSALTLVAWEIPALARRLPELWEVMKANTALCVLALAAGFLLSRDGAPRGARRLNLWVAILVIAVGALTLLEHRSGLSLGIDHLLVNRSLLALSGPPAETTAIALIMLGGGLFAAQRRTPLALVAADTLTTVLASWVILLAAGYVFGARILYESSASLRTAPQTLVAIAVLTLAIPVCAPGSGAFHLMAGKGSGSRFARLLLPAAVVAPFLFRYVGIELAQRDYVSDPYANATSVALNVLTLFLLISWGAARMNRAEQALRESSLMYQGLFEHNLAGIALAHIGKILDCNQAFLDIFGFRSVDEARNTATVTLWADPRVRDLAAEKIRRNGVLRDYEAEMRRRDGQPFHAIFSSVVLSGTSGREPVTLVSIIDITRRKEMEQALKESEERYRELFDNTSELVMSIRRDASLEYVNPAWKRALGYSDREIAAMKLWDILPPERQAVSREGLARLLRGEDLGKIERELLAKSGRRIHVEGVPGVRRDKDGRIAEFRILFHDITERKLAESWILEANKKLEESLQREKALARVDPLTGLFNRRAFFELGEFELALLRRHRRPVTLAYMDLDNFKQVNDEWGHEAGDALLVTVASTLRSRLRETDIVARLGGDEFAVLLPETEAQAGAEVMAKSVAELATAMRANAWPVTFSVGLVTDAGAARDFGRLVREADELMYAAKHSGKNRIEQRVHSGGAPGKHGGA